MPYGICRIGIRQPIPKRSETFEKKVCLTAFAESEFGNPFSFAESEFGNPGIFVTACFSVTKKSLRGGLTRM